MSHDCKKKHHKRIGPTGPTGATGATGPGADLCETSDQAFWFISAATGNDANTGLSPDQALKTAAELACRLRGKLIEPPIVLTPTPVRKVLVTILDDLPSSDPLAIQATLGPDTILQFQGIATVVSQGTLTAVTPPVVAPAGATAPYKVTDAARTSWPLFMRLRIPNAGGSGLDAISYVAEDLGAGQAATLDWSIPNPAPFPGATPVVISPGEAYVIEKLTLFTFGSNWDLKQTGNNQSLPGAFLVFDSLEAESHPQTVMSYAGTPALQTTFRQCRIQPLASFFSSVIYSVSTAWLNAAAFFESYVIMDGGGAFRASASPLAIPSGAAIPAGGMPLSLNLQFDEATFAQLGGSGSPPGCYGGPMWHVGPSGCDIIVRTAFTFKSVTASGHPGCGMMLLGPGNTCYIVGIFYGSGNQVKGVYVSAQSNLNRVGPFAKVTATGPVTSLVVGAVTDDYALGETGNSTSTALDPTTNTFLFPNRNNSWTTLDATIGAGGFGGNCLTPKDGAVIRTTFSFS